MTAVDLSPVAIDAIAERVAELLRGKNIVGELTDAAGIACRFGVSRDWVYGNADRLGAIRLGDGPKARLRFDPQKVEEHLAELKRAEDSPMPTPRQRPRRHKGSTKVELLPIRGRESA